MKKEDLENALEGISDKYIVEAAQSRDRKKNVRPKKFRSALIAAILILLAVGIPTAGFGAVYRYSVRNIEGGFEVRDKDGNTVYRDGYAVMADGEFEPAEFGEAKLKELEAYWYTPGAKNVYDYGRLFESYDDIAEWLGCEILSSDLLGERPLDIVESGALVLYTAGNAEVGVVDISISGSHKILAETKKICHVLIDIPRYAVDDMNRAWYSAGAKILSSETYTAANGLTVEIVESAEDTENTVFADERIKDNYITTHAYFIYGGAMYDYYVWGNSEEAAPILKQIVDSLD